MTWRRMIKKESTQVNERDLKGSTENFVAVAQDQAQTTKKITRLKNQADYERL